MKPEKAFHVLLSFSLAGMLLLSMAAPSFAIEAQFQGENINWHLTDGRVLYPGDVLTIDRSTLMTGYIVEAVAAASNGPIRRGVFRATLTAFSPVERSAGKDPDLWYLAGKWTISKAEEEGGMINHPPGGVVLEGNLAAERMLDLVAEQGVFHAPVKFLMTIGGTWPGKGEGIFLGDDGFEGHIRMTLAPAKERR